MKKNLGFAVKGDGKSNAGDLGTSPGWGSSILGWFSNKGTDKEIGEEGNKVLEQKLEMLVNEKIKESLKETNIGGQLQDWKQKELLYKKEIAGLRNEMKGGRKDSGRKFPAGSGEDSKNL